MASSPTWLGSPVRLHCTAAWPSSRFGGPPSFLRTAGRRCGPWRGGSRGPERTCSVWLPPAAASSPCPVALSVLPFPAPRLRPRVPLSVAASAALPPPALCSVIGRPGPGLLAPWGGGGFSLLPLLVGPRASPFPRFWFPPPLVARRELLAALAGGCGCWGSRFPYPECGLV